MNKNENNNQDDYRSLLLMAELEEGKPISQREIASRVGIALGLVNSYLRTLVGKGFVTVKAYPRNRFAYLLTPKGFAEKSQLAYRHLSNFHKLYKITRQDSFAMFSALREQGVQQVAFCGLDDLTEITYLSLREAKLELVKVMDEKPGSSFIDYPVVSLEQGVESLTCPIVITSLQRAKPLKETLLRLGVDEKNILAPSISYEEALHAGR